jgi:hypothetical protein
MFPPEFLTGAFEASNIVTCRIVVEPCKAARRGPSKVGGGACDPQPCSRMAWPSALVLSALDMWNILPSYACSLSEYADYITTSFLASPTDLIDIACVC